NARGFHRPNENKMSDGGRERALLGVEVWKSCQKWSVRRSAVRSIAWLDLKVAMESARRMNDFHRHWNLVHAATEWIDIERPYHEVLSNIRVNQSAPHLRHWDANAGAVLQKVFGG